MSGSKEKETRRSLRRAMGTEGLAIMQSHQSLLKNQIVPTVNDFGQRLDALAGRVARIEFPQDAADVTFRLEKFTCELDDRLHVFEKASATFWSRLIFLVRGVKK